MLGVDVSRRILLHDHVLEPQGDRDRLEGRLRAGGWCDLAGLGHVLDLPGPGNNTAFGHCALDFGIGLGLCTFSGGTGKFTQFQASANVSSLGGNDWAWIGTYSLGPR